MIVAGESGLKVLPEVIALGRTPDGALTEPVVVAQSAGIYRGDRYGDYFGAARDPLDPRTVWVGGEAGTDVPSGSGWATTVASVVVTAAGATPPAVAGTAPPGVRAVAVVARAGSPVHLAYRALDDGNAVRTLVVVQNAKKAIVYRASTARKTLRSDQRYFMLWPAKKVRGTLHVLREHRVDDRHAVAAELRAGHDSLSSSWRRAACAGASGSSSWRK